jgi:hypothetical protein
MSWNDMISTGVGGMSRGELSYRISSLILDNTKTGGRRILRDLGALAFNPNPRRQPLHLGEGHAGPGQPGRPLRLAPAYAGPPAQRRRPRDR